MKAIAKPLYRVCYEGGNPVTGEKVYELYKYCKCTDCNDRLTYKRSPSNCAIATTKDILKVDEAAEFLRNWTCSDGKRYLDTVYVRF